MRSVHEAWHWCSLSLHPRPEDGSHRPTVTVDFRLEVLLSTNAGQDCAPWSEQRHVGLSMEPTGMAFIVDQSWLAASVARSPMAAAGFEEGGAGSSDQMWKS